MHKFLYGFILIILLQNSFQDASNVIIYKHPSLNEDNNTHSNLNESLSKPSDFSENNEFVVTQSSSIPSDNIISVLKNFKYDSDPTAQTIQKYLQSNNKQDHIFNDIWQRISSNITISNHDLNINNNNNSYEVENFDRDSVDLMSAHETQTQDHKDQLTNQLISTSTAVSDVKNNELTKFNPMTILHRRGPSYLSSNDQNQFQHYLSCCDQLFNKYGNRNYIQEDVFMLPESADRYVPFSLDGPGPPPVIVSEFEPSNIMKPPSALYSHTLRTTDFVNNNKIDANLYHANVPKTQHKAIECIDGTHHHAHQHYTGNDHIHQHNGRTEPPPNSGSLISTSHQYDVNSFPNFQKSIEHLPVTVHRIVSTSIPGSSIYENKDPIMRQFQSFNNMNINTQHDSSLAGPLSANIIPYNNKHQSTTFAEQPTPIQSPIDTLTQNHQYRLNSWPMAVPIPPPPTMHISSPRSGYLSKKLSLLGKKYFLG